MERADVQPTPLRSAVFFRDGLIIALLALCPMRRRNLAGLTLGQDLMCSGGNWTIVLPPTATKTHVTLEYGWPELLNDYLKTYLTKYRPILLARKGRWRAPVQDHLWVSWDGSPFTEMGIYDRIIQRTRTAFGRSINPHLFRDAAATTVAIHDPVHVRASAPLLGHRTFATTERYYMQAQTLEAHREFTRTLTSLRKQVLPDEGPDS
jgi:site-specific recombinase XerD